MEQIVPEDLIGEILQETAELEVLFPDPDYMQTAIARWSRTRMFQWERMYTALYAEYEPLWNKDAHITETHTMGPESETRIYGQKQGSTAYGQTQNTTAYGQTQDTTAYGARSSTSTLGARHAEGQNQVSAFNSNAFEPAEKSISDQNSATDSTSELAHTDTVTGASHTDTMTGASHTDTVTEQQHTDTISSLQHKDEIDRVEQGNIGITTSQQMLEAEMKVRAAYDLYQIIAHEYIRKFCLMIY